jgi:signal transduction histidine kinase
MTLIIPTANGLNKFDSKTGTFTRYLNDSSNPETISDNYIITIYEDSRGVLWVGTDNGLNRFDHKKGTFISYLNDSSNPNSISANSIYNIIEDNDGLLWIGTNYGLNSFDLNENIFKHYSDGLKSILIFGILEDDNGDIWVSTNKGLGRLNIDTGVFLQFDQKNGLNNIEYTSGACCKTINGDLFFGGSDGIDYFNPYNIVNNSNISDILITGFLIDGNRIRFDEPVEGIDSVKLSYSNNSFTIEYVTLDYNSQVDNQYMYILEGFDELWHYSNYERNFAAYTNIPAGNYTFLVKGANSSGVWNETGATLKITIAHPFWQQWWFILAMAVTVVLMMIALIKYITYSSNLRAQRLETQVIERTRQLINRTEQLENTSQKLEKSNKLLENQIQQRIEFTRALVHELKTPLTSAINSSEALIDQSNSDIMKRLSRNIYVSAIKLNKRINELLDLSKIEVGTLNVNCRPMDLITLIKEMSYNMLLEATKKEQTLKIELPDELPMIMADEERLEQVISNLLNNALKYNKRNGEILLKVSSDNDNVIIEVTDEGLGIEKDNLAKIFEPYIRLGIDKDRFSGLGIGLALTKNLVELQDGKIWVTSKVGEGSSFFVSFPIYN